MQDALEDGLDELEYAYGPWRQQTAARAIVADDAALEAFIEAFVAERRFDLAALLDMDADDHEAVTAALDSALTLFRCRTCTVGGLGAHELLGHKCIEERKTILADGVDRSLTRKVIKIDTPDIARTILDRTAIPDDQRTHSGLADRGAMFLRAAVDDKALEEELQRVMPPWRPRTWAALVRECSRDHR